MQNIQKYVLTIKNKIIFQNITVTDKKLVIGLEMTVKDLDSQTLHLYIYNESFLKTLSSENVYDNVIIKWLQTDVYVSKRL